MDSFYNVYTFSSSIKRGVLITLLLGLSACGGSGGGGGGTEVVPSDIVSPEINLNGDNEVTLLVGETYTEMNATATDAVDGSVTVNLSGNIDTNTAGVYTITYTATDSANNSISITRTVNVIARDTTPDAFTFTDEVGSELGQSKQSNAITISGINSPAEINVVAGEYSIDGAEFTSIAATVISGQTVSVKHNSADQNDVITETTLTIGGVSDTYTTTSMEYAGQLALIPSGSDIVLMGMNALGELTERSRSALSDEFSDYSTNHVIFSIVKHPLKNMVFVSSFNECGALPLDTDGCWGNARIDRFTYDSNTITYDGLAYLAQGPLRLSTPSFNELTSEVSVSLTNQGSDDITITSLVIDILTTDSSYTTTCDGEVLSAGEQCSATITAGTGVNATGAITVTTPIADFTTQIEYSNSLGYSADGLDSSAYSLPGLPGCAVDDFGKYNQLGGCAMTAMAISADGTRAYVNEDDYDTTLVFSIDDAGNMALLSQDTAGVDLQGIAVNAENSAMYNGSNAYSITDDIVTEESYGEGGNSTEVTTDLNGQTLLISTIDNSTLSIFELDTAPLVPTLIASFDPSLGKARYQDHSLDLSTFAVIDHEDIAILSFDGSTLVELNSMDISIDVGLCESCNFRAATRAVQVTDDGLFAVTSAFVNAYDELTSDALLFSGAATSYSIAPETGALVELDQLTFDGMSRTILFIETP